MSRSGAPHGTVRRLVAVDMWGARGTAGRRRMIMAEFLGGAIVLMGLGLISLGASSSLGTRTFGLWAVGAGLNYLPLAAHALGLMRPGALDAELAGVDTGRALRRYAVVQLWILVPLALVAMELHDIVRRRGAR